MRRMGNVSRAMKMRQTAAEACAQDLRPQFHPCWWVTPGVLPGASAVQHTEDDKVVWPVEDALRLRTADAAHGKRV